MSTTKQVVIFRADGDNKTGLGHIIRTSALADMINQAYTCILATRCTIPSVLSQVRPAFDEVIGLPEDDYEKEAMQMRSRFSQTDLIVLDGYSFDDRYQQMLTQSGFDIFCIDDIHAFPFLAKLIINHSGGLSPADYTARPATQFYLGPHYSLLRKPFLQAAKSRRTSIDNRNCFICFGGADPDNKTVEVLQQLQRKNTLQFDQFHVVAGSANIHLNEIENFSQAHKNIFLYNALSAEELVAVMQQCAFAVCSPSTVVYEYMSIGGVVFLEQIADNQKDVKRFMIESGLAFSFADIQAVQEDRMKASLEKQAAVFDGKSDTRFLKIFSQYFNSKDLSLRRATPADMETCFHWANDPEVRSQSYNQAAIAMDDHITWFNAKLKDPRSFFYIIEQNQRPVAQIRFQLNGDEAVLGYLADQSIRKKGIGTAILGRGIERFTEELHRPVRIIGFVKKSNIASQRSFERLAFDKEESKEYPDSFKYTMYYGN